MSGLFAEGSVHGGWTIKSLQQDGVAPRYEVEADGKLGTLTYYPFHGPFGTLHQALAERVKRLKDVRHENLVPVTYGEVEKGLFVAQPVFERLGEEPLEEMAACQVLMNVAGGLEALYSQGVVHGELDPLCLVQVNGAWKLQPPGLRLAPPGVKKLGLEVDPRYASPEVLDGQPPSRQGDMFSLGLVLYRLLSGKAPVTGSDPSEAFAARGKDQVPDLKAGAASVQKVMLAFYAKLTALRAERRPQTVEELLRDLNRVGRGKATELNPLPEAGALRTERVGGALLLAALFLGAAGGLFVYATQILTVSSPAEGFAFKFEKRDAKKTDAAAKTDADEKTGDEKTEVKTGDAEKTGDPEKTGDEKTGDEKTGDEKTGQ